MIVVTLLRLLLTAALLVEVWRHSHWSVALALTLSCFWAELFAYEKRRGK